MLCVPRSVGLPVEVQQTIVTVYCSICKARQYAGNDHTAAKLLLEHAHSKCTLQ